MEYDDFAGNARERTQCYGWGGCWPSAEMNRVLAYRVRTVEQTQRLTSGTMWSQGDGKRLVWVPVGSHVQIPVSHKVPLESLPFGSVRIIIIH